MAGVVHNNAHTETVPLFFTTLALLTKVIVVINGLRVKNKAVFQFPPVAKETSNADIKLSFEDREFNLVVYVKMKERENDCYQLRAKTPQTIEPEPKSFYKVEKDKIIIFLKKQIKKSWLQVGDNIDVLEPEDDTV
ncbi:uncharacterized protein LOC144351958 [Saccoglossus kowalevskii]